MIQPLRVGGKRQLDHRLFGGGDLSGDCTLFAFSIANLARPSTIPLENENYIPRTVYFDPLD